MARAAVAPVLRTAARSAPGPARSSVDGAGAWRSPHSGSAIKTKSTRRNHIRPKAKTIHNRLKRVKKDKQKHATRAAGAARSQISQKTKLLKRKKRRVRRKILLYFPFSYITHRCTTTQVRTNVPSAHSHNCYKRDKAQESRYARLERNTDSATLESNKPTHESQQREHELRTPPAPLSPPGSSKPRHDHTHTVERENSVQKINTPKPKVCTLYFTNT
jgi:hypothetical protein